MNTKTLLIRKSGLLLILPLLLAACAPAGSAVPAPTSVPALAASPTPAANATPTVTVSGNECAYQGPAQIPGKVTFTWDIRDPVQPGTGSHWVFNAVTLAPGKTADDIRALPSLFVTSTDQPAWLTPIEAYGVRVSGIHADKTWDFSSNGAYNGEPVYIVCQDNDKTLGVLGPFEISK